MAVVATDDGGVVTIREQDIGQRNNMLEPVFKNGKLLREYDENRLKKKPHKDTTFLGFFEPFL